MKTIPVTKSFFQGAVSVDPGPQGLQPWRLPCGRRDLFSQALCQRALDSSGVRLRFATRSRRVDLACSPLAETSWNPCHRLDATVDNNIVATAEVPYGGEKAVFEPLPEGLKTVEIWLPHASPIRVQSLGVEDGCNAVPVPDSRLRWVTYGSSLTHCVRAHSSAGTWPALVARAQNWHLTSLGFGGNCCLEPLVGMVIRDLPADLITLKLGINCISGALSPRTFPSAVIGLVLIIREKHPHTPLMLISPMAYPPHETEPNVLGYTIGGMRNDIEEVHRRLCELGDRHLYYANGLEMFNADEIAVHTTDQCHPDAEGITLQGRHFIERFVPRIPLPAAADAVQAR